ncbi:MAG: 50S ribosomal protein L25 [Spirochaetaceae bacterium]|nr:MAG: 50S ribosomal protein L25 [Spirochaetaceae bacterium]
MEQKTLTATARTERKKGAAGRLRRSGKIPCVVYGREEPVSITIDAHEFGRTFKTISESQIVNVNIDGNGRECLIKDYDQDILTGSVKHVDFYEIERGKLLRTNVHVETEGSPRGVREGGVLETPTRELEIECMPADIPDHITIDISLLEIGDAIHAGDITPPEGVQIISNLEQVLAMVTQQRVEEEVSEEGEGEAGAEGAASVPESGDSESE